MTEFEYQEKLMDCLTYKKWQVVNDAVDMLNNMNCNYEVVLSEIRAERQAIITMLDSDASNKQKLHFVESFAEDWRRKGASNDSTC
jgi:predicted transcriptional regulator YheO